MSDDGPLPPHELFAVRFRSAANHLAIAYGGPLFLVGSAITSRAPGDIDLRLCLDRVDMVTLWGEAFDKNDFEWSPGKLLRHREELKQSRRLTRGWGSLLLHMLGTNRVDFQFQCGLFSDIDGLPIMHEGKPNLRLDAIPLDYFAAGRGDP